MRNGINLMGLAIENQDGKYCVGLKHLGTWFARDLTKEQGERMFNLLKDSPVNWSGITGGPYETTQLYRYIVASCIKQVAVEFDVPLIELLPVKGDIGNVTSSLLAK